jgi:uncharacterized protein YycO
MKEIDLSLIKPADLFFTRSRDFVSWAIRQRTWGIFSHVQIIVSEDRDQKIDVISADANGVFCRAVTDQEFEKYAILTYPEITGEERTNVVRFCLSQIGKAYDFLGLASFLFYKQLQSDSRWFCSELAYVAYKQAGIRLQRRVKQDFISPRDLYISPLLKPIAGNAEYDWM